MKKSVQKLCKKEEFIKKKKNMGKCCGVFMLHKLARIKSCNSSCMMSLQCCNRLITPGNFTTNFAETTSYHELCFFVWLRKR